MSMELLDKSGLAYFWSKIKSALGLKADDSAVVHLAGTETVTGAKTFSNDVTVNQSSIKATVKDTNSSTTRTEVVFRANSSNSSYGINTMFGSSSSVVIGAGEGKSSQLTELAGTGNEHVYLIADSNIYLKSNANTYANARILSYKADGNITYENPSITRGTNPSSTVERSVCWNDSNNARLGVFSNAYFTDGSSQTAIYAYKTTVATGNNIGKLGIGCDASGNVYTVAPTPSSAADNTTKIATTAWVRTATGNFACNAATASSAAKLTTARKINGVSFDGSADVTLTAVISSVSRASDIAADGTFTVPSYIVGAQALLVYLDGCLSRQGDGWDEVGTAGDASTTIKFNQLIPMDMEISVRVN